MTDAQYRRFCAERRRRWAMHRNLTLGVSAFGLMLLLAVSLHAITGRASTPDAEPDYKYYTYYTVQAGDTLDSIAESYADGHFSGSDAYVREVVGINSLFADTELRSGEEIVLPYYSPEYK